MQPPVNKPDKKHATKTAAKYAAPKHAADKHGTDKHAAVTHVPEKHGTDKHGTEKHVTVKHAQGKDGAHAAHGDRNLSHLPKGESAILDRIELPEEDARRLMELGFLPGHTVTSAHSAPGGDPRVFRVDGSEVALRRETARHLILRKAG